MKLLETYRDVRLPDFIIRQLIVALACAALYQVCVVHFSTNVLLAGFFPVSGLAIAAILINKKYYLIGIFAGIGISQLYFSHAPLLIAAFTTSGGAAEAFAGAWLLNNYKKFNPCLEDPHSFLYLALMSMIIPAVSTLFLVITLSAHQGVTGPEFVALINQYWIGDSVIITLFTPLVLVWRTPPQNIKRTAVALEFVAIILLSFVVGQIIFYDWFSDTFGNVNRGYWMFVVVLVAAIRTGRHGVVAILLLTAIQALSGASAGKGFFRDDIHSTHLVNLWTYIAALTLVGMIFAIILKNRTKNLEKLRKSEAQLLETQHLAGIASWTWDIQSNKHWWSKEIYEFYGHDPALGPAVYPEVQKYFTPDSWAILTQQVADCVQTGKSYECDAEVVRPDGSHRWIIARGEATLNDGGKVCGLHGTVQDITVRKLAQLQLANSEANFRALFENSPNAMVAIDPASGHIIQTNANADTLWGYDRDELLSLSMTDITHPDDVMSSRFRVDEFVRSSSVNYLRFEKRYRRKDGSYFWAEVSIAAVRDESERPLYTIASIVNISERKQIEQELCQLSLAVEQSPESIVITGLDARIEYVNTSSIMKSGYSRDELIGQNTRLFKSERTPVSTFESLWSTLKRGEVWEGEFINRNKNGTDYIEHAIVSPIRQTDGCITHYVAIKEDITEKVRSKKQIHRLAYFDEITELPNFAMLREHISQSILKSKQSGAFSALLTLNIDRFKMVNDANGQSLSNVLLKSLGERLVRILHTTDVVSRTSGDEFCILFPELELSLRLAAHLVMQISQKIHACMRMPFEIGGKEIILTACHGIALFAGNETDNPYEVLRRAETALHHAKHHGCGQTVFFEDSLEYMVKQRFAIEGDLRQAINQNELMVYLQSQVNDQGQIMGAEALVRWLHPRQGIISPAQFIPIAEETNLIIDIDNWVLGEVCRSIAEDKISRLPVRFAVNISARHFSQADFVQQIKETLRSTGANPYMLTLEITEGVVIGNIDEVIEKIGELSAIGVHFSMDDFGTGYSSLSYLKRLPIHELKIDKSFIQEVTCNSNDAALVEVILSVASHLKLKVVAEGVETLDQAAFLQKRAQVLHQGYLYSKPEPMADWLAKLVSVNSFPDGATTT